MVKALNSLVRGGFYHSCNGRSPDCFRLMRWDGARDPRYELNPSEQVSAIFETDRRRGIYETVVQSTPPPSQQKNPDAPRSKGIFQWEEAGLHLRSCRCALPACSVDRVVIGRRLKLIKDFV